MSRDQAVERIKLQASILDGRASNDRLIAQGKEIIAKHPELAGTICSVLASMAFHHALYEATCESRWGVTAERFMPIGSRLKAGQIVKVMPAITVYRVPLRHRLLRTLRRLLVLVTGMPDSMETKGAHHG